MSATMLIIANLEVFLILDQIASAIYTQATIYIAVIFYCESTNVTSMRTNRRKANDRP